MKYPKRLGCLLDLLLRRSYQFNRRRFLDSGLRVTIKSLGIAVLILILLLILFLITKSLPLFSQPEVQIRTASLSFETSETLQEWSPLNGHGYTHNHRVTTEQMSSLVLPDQPTNRWQGGQWRIVFTPKLIHFKLWQNSWQSEQDVESDGSAHDIEDDHAVNSYRQSLELPNALLTYQVVEACSLPSHAAVLAINQQGQLFSWNWQGNQSFPGRFHIKSDATVRFAEDLEYFQAFRNLLSNKLHTVTEPKERHWKLSCHRDRPFVLVWNEKRWWLWSYTTNKIVFTEARNAADTIEGLSARARLGFAFVQDSANLLSWGWYSPDVRNTGQTPLWQLDLSSPGLVDWQALIWGAEVLGLPDNHQLWEPTYSDKEFQAGYYSFLPLLLGSFQIALLALFLATPLSLSAAVYSSQFFSKRLRGKLKPTIELIEAVPSVILGFIAVVAFGPWLENHLFSFLLVLSTLPLVFIAAGFFWSWLPKFWHKHFIQEYELLLVFPLLIFSIMGIFTLGEMLELQFFSEGFIHFLHSFFGVTYQSHNALLTSLVMAIALIPTLYSIAEDALYAVPKVFRDGSLALGATPWQTLIRVILPAASPGIFAALMIGLGRALGETMIVLMVSGNHANTSLNIFEGLRSLSATLVLEMPAAPIHSLHYHLLFFIALLLFCFTFLINGLAEKVRAQLRLRYSAL